jgi:disulfide bond formation protein DsbB
MVPKSNKYILVLISVILCIASILAFYHSLVERGIAPPPSICSSLLNIKRDSSIEDIKAMIYNQPTANCAKVLLKIGNLSMTEWNFILNVCIFCSIMIIMRHRALYAKT